MGPRLFSRGNRVRDHVPVQENRLQWGRDSSAAEMSVNQVAGIDWVPLQWGRDSSAAEMIGLGEQAAILHKSFNGAATLQPRKSRPGGAKPSGPRLASMGPRLFSRGNPKLPATPTTLPTTLQWGRDSSAAEMSAVG